MRLNHQPTEEAIAPFLPSIAEAGDEAVTELWRQLYVGEVHPHTIEDAEGVAVALCGTRFLAREGGTLGEIVWCTGEGATDWVHLIEEVFDWLKTAGCGHVRALCRPGWGPELRKRGFKKSHEIWDMKL